MHCINCGTELDSEDLFCRKCGTKVVYSANEAAAADDIKFDSNGPKEKTHDTSVKKSRIWLIWLIPVITAVIAGGLVFTSYRHQVNIDSKVERIKQQAEDAAMEGKFQEASKLVSQALELRPNYPALKTDAEILKKGQNISGILQNVDNLINSKDYNGALTNLLKADTSIKQDNGVFLGIFSKIIDNKRTMINVMQLQNDASSKQTLLQLCPIYKVVSAINTPDAKKVASNILKNIENIAANEEKAALASKNYSTFYDELDMTSRYLNGNKKVLDLKNAIQNKMDQMEGKIKDITKDILTRENSITSGSVKITADSTDGADYKEVSGTVFNNGDFTIYNTKVLLKIYDEYGNVIDEVTVNCDPETIEPGGGTNFSYYFTAPYPKYVRPVGAVYNEVGSGDSIQN
ncbi:MAG: FxLYD domain-containing protein [Bacillota bacterium]|nr:FxLYD domain-containing protein [Bacillota bacterium]